MFDCGAKRPAKGLLLRDHAGKIRLGTVALEYHDPADRGAGKGIDL
jgi:hypothetical protein